MRFVIDDDNVSGLYECYMGMAGWLSWRSKPQRTKL